MFTQPQTEMSTRKKQIFFGSKARPLRIADNLTAICEPIAYTILGGRFTLPIG
jgi:hypothetical protein